MILQALKRAVDVDITVQVNTTVNSTVTTSDLTQYPISNNFIQYQHFITIIIFDK